MSSLKLDVEVFDLLSKIPGFVSMTKVSSGDLNFIIKSESEYENSRLLGFNKVENTGVKETLKSKSIYAVAYYSIFFEASKNMESTSSVVIESDGKLIGEEVYDEEKLEDLRKSNNAIFLGKNFVMYKDRMRISRGDANLILPSKSVPHLHGLQGNYNVVSGSPSSKVDHYLKNKMSVSDDPDIGTVLVGISEKKLDE